MNSLLVFASKATRMVFSFKFGKHNKNDIFLLTCTLQYLMAEPNEATCLKSLTCRFNLQSSRNAVGRNSMYGLFKTISYDRKCVRTQ